MLMIYYNESYLYLDACNLEIVLIMFDVYLSKHTKREGKRKIEMLSGISGCQKTKRISSVFIGFINLNKQQI